MDQDFEQSLKNLLAQYKEDNTPDLDYEGIAEQFTNFLKEHMPQGTAVVFAFAKHSNKIMCVVGGVHPQNPIYDALVVKIAGQVDGRREFDSTATEVTIDHHTED